jgi:hypothetical protein
MESSRSSWGHSVKLDEKVDDEGLSSGATSDQQAEHDGDLEKGSEPRQTSATGQTDDNDAFLVKWEEDEPANPRNWSNLYKAFLTFQLGMLAMSGSLGSSIIAPAQGAIAEEFGVSRQATVLCVALYVLGECNPLMRQRQR